MERTGLSRLDLLHTFALVGAQQSFTRAAERLGVPKSTVSRRIQQLELDLDVVLINRDNRHFELTPQGELLLRSSQEIVNRAEIAFDEIRSEQKGLRGVVAISTTADLAQLLLTRPVAELCQRNPELRVQIDVTPRVLDLMKDGFDLALRVGPLKDSELLVKKVKELPIGLFASPKYLQAHGELARVSDLKEHRVIAISKFSAQGCLISPTVEANNMTLIRDLVGHGLGIGLMDIGLAQSREWASRLVPVLKGVSFPRVPIYLVFQNRRPSLRVRELARLILELN